MAVDVRGYTTAIGQAGILGRVVSGQIGDSYISGGVGLVKTSGHVVVQGFVSPKAGTRVRLLTTFPRGNAYQIPRTLRVLSSTIIPQDRTTRIELGCRLKYFEDLADADYVVHRSGALMPRSTAEAQPSSFYAIMSGAAVAAVCAAQVGVGITGSIGLTFAREYVDVSAGYVTVLDQMIASTGQVGYLDPTNDVKLLLVSASPSASGAAISYKEDKIISVSPMGIGQLPADAVSVAYNGLRLKADEGTEKTEQEWLSGFSETFTRSATTSYSTITVPYQDPSTGEQATKRFDVRDFTAEESTSDVINGNRVMIKREQVETKSSVAVAGAVVTDYLSAGVPWGARSVTSTTTETFSYNNAGQETERQLVRRADRLYGLGSLGLPMSFPSSDPEAVGGVDLVPLPTGTMELEKIITTTFRSGRLQKTITRRYGPWIQTPMGQQTIAEAREYFDTAQKVVDFIAFALDGSFLLDVSISSQRASDTNEAVASFWEANLPNLADDETDPADENRAERITESVYAVGSGGAAFVGTPYDSVGDEGLTAGMTPEEIAALTELAANQRAPMRRVALTIPYSDDDRLTRITGVGDAPPTFRVAKGRGEDQARVYGKVYNELLIGVRYGLSVQVAATRLPQRPFTPIAIQIAGTSGLFRSNAASWTISNDGIVGSMDALFAGGIGGPSYSFPIAQDVVAPTTLPTETNNEPDQVVGTVEDVGETPQTVLDAAFPDAVAGDGVQDLATLDYWVYDGSDWANVGPNPGPTVEVTPLPVVTETDVVRLRSRHRLTVEEFDYALGLPTVTVTVASKTKAVVTNP